MTSPEAIKRATSHSWLEVDAETEACITCGLRLPKSIDLEEVPACEKSVKK